MKKSITQETDYGCGIACFAFVADLTLAQAAGYLNRSGKTRDGVHLMILLEAMNSYGLASIRKYVKSHLLDRINEEGTIVLTKRSKEYPVGHYLVRYENQWMDPWLNFLDNKDVKNAKSGFRDELPGEPVYAILPIEDQF